MRKILIMLAILFLMSCSTNEDENLETNSEYISNDISFIELRKIIINNQTYLITKYSTYAIFVNNLTLDSLQKKKLELEIKNHKGDLKWEKE